MQIYNTQSRTKESFKPLVRGQVGLYVCGVTVYDYCHIGHARTYIAFDVIVRYLRYRGYEVRYVRNITDIDDKIIQRAHENQEPYTQLTTRVIKAMHDDFESLHLLAPDDEPRATEYMSEMIAMIEQLIEKGYAYKADNNDVYYNVRKFKNYGQLSNRKLDDMRSGARVQVGEAKKDPLDFVLWKHVKPGEPSWPSPWGEGRPGWHLECSTMSNHLLGNTFDIHGGGFDLIFPHHENECAQSEACTEQPFVKTWMHAGFLQVNKEKMSKSLGNFWTIRDVMAKYDVESVRHFMISSHYRSPLDYSTEQLELSRSAMERLYVAMRDLDETVAPIPDSQYEARFVKVMDDDFNTPEALAVLFELAREINRLKKENLYAASQYGALLKKLAGILGLIQLEASTFFKGIENNEDIEKIEMLIQQRQQARANKDWALADEVRSELTKLGVILEDTAEGTIWRRN